MEHLDKHIKAIQKNVKTVMRAISDPPSDAKPLKSSCDAIYTYHKDSIFFWGSRYGFFTDETSRQKKRRKPN